MKDDASGARRKLSRYRKKRDFNQTSEPSGAADATAPGRSYLIQKHAARRLHYDFRLELDGVLKSWAVTRGPSLNPQDKRLAVHVEDHPLDYGSFEGTIPHGQYGGGTVMLWDQGSWEALGDPRRDYARGNLTFLLKGKRLKGRWHLVRLRGSRAGDAKRDNWLLIKGKDQYADEHGDTAIENFQTSVVSRRGMEGIGKSTGQIPKSEPQKGDAHAKSAQKAAKGGSRRAAADAARVLPDAGQASAPAQFVMPQLATLVSAPPLGEGWVHEIKFDGYRLLSVIENSSCRLFTRAANDWTDRFPPLASALAKLKLASAVIDGEAVVTGADGAASFHALQDALSRQKLEGLRYYAFDLLHLNGVDLRPRPLTERKALLADILQQAPALLQYSEHFAEPGDKILAHACSLALEGIVSKQATAAYRSGRTSSWLKSKCVKEQEFVIGGYTEQPKHPGVLGALLIGYYERDTLQFAGKVGTGFTVVEGSALLKKLKSRGVSASPFASLPTDARRGAHFVRPELVAHVNFGEWTPDGKLRHPSFQGIREDKPAREVVREIAKPVTAATAAPAKSKARPRKQAGAATSVDVANVTITHPDRVLWTDGGITKLQLAQYYADIAPRLLAHAGGRPLSVVRCPQGPGKACFFQRHAGAGMPEHVHEINIAERGEGKPFLFIDDTEGLISLVQMGTIELHAWNSLVSDPKKPDRLIFDLDPAPDVPWDEVRKAAQDLRAALKKLGLVAFLKTTGGKGLHLVVPFAPGPAWAEAKAIARGFCEVLANAQPQRFTINNRKDVRGGHIYLDYLRNDETASAVVAYSVRARPKAPVSLPIEWRELGQLKCGDSFRMEDALKRRKDPWADIASAGQQKLPRAQ